MEKYLIVIEYYGENYSVYSPDVPGCVSVGNTLEEAADNIREALDLHFEGLARDGDEMPLPRGLKHYVDHEPDFASPGAYITHLEIDLAKYQTPAHA